MKSYLMLLVTLLRQLASISEMKVNAPRNIINNLPEDIDELLFGMTNGEVSDDNNEGDLVEGVWDANEYADEDAYGEAAETFVAAHQFISDKGGKITIPGTPEVTFTALPGGDIGYSFVVEF